MIPERQGALQTKSELNDFPTSCHEFEAVVRRKWTQVEAGRLCEWKYREIKWTVVLEKTLESPLDCKEIKPVHPKGDQSWIFIGRTEAKAEVAPILWPPDAKSWLIWKDPDAGKDWRREKKGPTEDEIVGWHHWLNGLEFAQAAPGVGEGQGSLACCSPWGHKESGLTEQLNWTEGGQSSQYTGEELATQKESFRFL